MKSITSETVFLFGFTSILWQHFYPELNKAGKSLELAKRRADSRRRLEKAGRPGGEIKRSSNRRCSSVCGDIRVLDYYGMVEQTGTIYLECEHGHLHAPVWSDVLIRRPLNFSLADPGETGLIEVVSVLPGSYPGHALLTEDEGRDSGRGRLPLRADG